MIFHKKYNQCLTTYSQLTDLLSFSLGSTIYSLWYLQQIIKLGASVSHLYYSITLEPTSKAHFGELIEIICYIIFAKKAAKKCEFLK